MHHRRLFIVPVVLCFFVAISACKKSPAAPAATRVVAINGPVEFGNVPINTAAQRTMVISNTGNDTLTVTGLSTTVPGNLYTADWLSGTIPAGGSQTVTIVFRPVAVGSFNGAVLVQGNHTSGFNSTPVNGSGV